MIIFEEPTSSSEFSDVMRWYAKDSDGAWSLVAVFPDSTRTEENSLWHDNRNGMVLQNNLVTASDNQRMYHTVMAIYDRSDRTKHTLFAMEVFVMLGDGSVTFENKWARLSPASNFRNFATIAASQSMVI